MSHSKRMNNEILSRVLAVQVFVFVCLPGFSAGIGETSPQQRISKSVPARESVEITLVSADCLLESGGPGEIQIEVLHDYGEGRYEAEIGEWDGKLLLRERFLGSSHRGSATWHVTVPEKTRVFFSSASGTLESQGDLRQIEARSASGRILVRKLEGEIDLSTASGDVGIRDIRGRVSMSTASGSVEARDTRGRISVRTVSGDIELRDVQAEVEAFTASGKIDVEELKIERESTFSAASGDIEVVLAARPERDLSLSSAAGRVLLDYNDNPVEGIFEFSALEKTGCIVSPFAFDSEETFLHSGQRYVRRIFTRGNGNPVITLATASGRAELKE